MNRYGSAIAPEITLLAKQIGGLYLNPNFSDVTIIVEGTEIPAHRNILSQRCPYFKAMFSNGMAESVTRRVKLYETPIASFKVLLKWIYTGKLEINSLNTALEVLQISRMYNLRETEELTMYYIEDKCTVDNVCSIINSVVFVTDRIVATPCFLFISDQIVSVLAHESLSILSTDVLTTLLKDYLYDATNIEILKALVRWMNDNPDQSNDFIELLKLVPLSSMHLGDVLSIVPSHLITATDLIEVGREQKLLFESGSIVDVNFATPKYGAKAFIGAKCIFFGERFIKEFNFVGITEMIIDLGQLFNVNSLMVDCVGTNNYRFNQDLLPDFFVSANNEDWVHLNLSHPIDSSNSSLFYNFDHIIRFVHVKASNQLDKVLDLNSFSIERLSNNDYDDVK